MEYKFAYIVWNLLFFFVWGFLYLRRKDLRKEIVVVSIFFGFAGLIADMFFTQDYWEPLTAVNTRIGPETFLIGFFIGGTAASIYEEIFVKKVVSRKEKGEKVRFINSFCLGIVLFLVSFFILDLSSFYSSAFAMIVPWVWIIVKRKDLFFNSFLSAFLVTITGISIYFILILMYPGIIKEWWIFEGSWFNKLILGVPLGEYVFYFVSGLFIGPFYEYWKGQKLSSQQVFKRKPKRTIS